jgi:hypothetical protein
VGAFRRRGADAAGDARPLRPHNPCPEDEICFFLFDAQSGREAGLVVQQAAFDPFPVVKAVSSGKE